jgi:ABC-2 type transport system ATP-binding protein
MNAAVLLRGLSKSYGRRPALRAVDLTLASNQIAGIVGPDGAGKTTLIRALAGLLMIDAAESAVLGHDLRGDVTALKAEVGYVPQAFSLQPELSVMENLKFTARLHRIEAAVFEERARELLERIGLAPFVDRAAAALSGGMKQKLAVINALLPSPRLVLLDEPTAGVDVTARAEIWEMLEAARRTALVVISTSYLDEAEACDRLVYLESGRVVAEGRPAELRARVPLELYRVWSDDPRRLARGARRLAYVEGARQTGITTRIEVSRDRSPGFARIRGDLRAIGDPPVHLVEQLPIDMEATLLHLSRAES